MKRTLLIGLSVVVVAAIFSQTWQVETQAYADKRQETPETHKGTIRFNSYEPSPGKQIRTIRVPVLSTMYVDKVIEVSEESQRSQLYSNLMLQKSQRMSEDELEAAIAEAQAELAAENEAADAEIRRAVEVLEQLVQNSAGTPAAERAGLALSVLKGQVPMPEPTGPTPYRGGVPTPVDPAPAY